MCSIALNTITIIAYLLAILFTFSNLLEVSSEELPSDVSNHPNFRLLDHRDTCGVSLTDRIIGGDKASLGQYPWMARLGFSIFPDEDTPEVDGYDCGGTIISERYILSAAHCVPALLAANLVSIRLGENDANSDPDCRGNECAPPVQDIAVDNINCHKKYNEAYTYQNDVCLIRLKKPIQFNKYVRPVCLPFYNSFAKDYVDKIMEVAGWGITQLDTLNSYAKVGSNHLMTLKVPVLSHKDCVDSYKNKIEIGSKQMCAGGVIGKDSCGGDSGGPLMSPFAINGPPRYYIIGVVSFGPKKCAKTTTPGVYTKVFEYRKWILDNIHE